MGSVAWHHPLHKTALGRHWRSHFGFLLLSTNCAPLLPLANNHELDKYLAFPVLPILRVRIAQNRGNRKLLLIPKHPTSPSPPGAWGIGAQLSPLLPTKGAWGAWSPCRGLGGVPQS